MENKEVQQQMVNEVSSQFVVRSTTDYDRFKWLNGNRTPNQMHLTRLKSSIEKKALFSPILVNENFEIIDGQHRFLAMKELGLPIFYIITSGYGLEEIKILNTNTSNWKREDYLKAYCDMGSPNYLLFKQFSEKYPVFGFQAVDRLVTLKTNGTSGNTQVLGNYKDGKKMKSNMKDFENGLLQIPDYEKSKEYAEKIMMMEPFYANYNRGVFVSTMIILFQNPEYNHDEMLQKLQMQPTKLVDCTNITKFRELLEDIYNFKRRTRVNLRF